jgi:hypothetical protein
MIRFKRIVRWAIPSLSVAVLAFGYGYAQQPTSPAPAPNPYTLGTEGPNQGPRGLTS